MHGCVAGEERQAVGQLEATARDQRALTADPRGAQSRLVNQLHCQPRLDSLRRLSRPTAQQIPSPQPQVFRHQQPDSDRMPADLVAQELAHPALDTDRVTRLPSDTIPGISRFDR